MRFGRGIPKAVTLLRIVAVAALMIGSTAWHCAAIEEENLPQAAVSQGQTPQPAVSPANGQSDDWEREPSDNGNLPAASEPMNAPATAPGNPQPAYAPTHPAAQSEPPTPSIPAAPESVMSPPVSSIPTEAPSPTPTPEPPPALDVSAIDTEGDIAMKQLDAEIKAAETPAMAASLRVTEQARKQLAKGSIDAAVRSLTQAVSIDPADPFAYYFLGRAHFERKNYRQALTFFYRAQLGFSGKPVWMGEVLSYEGQCEEALGDQLKAAKAYQQALAVAPGNFRARIGYGRLSAMLAPAPNADMSPPSSNDAHAAPSSPIDAPPPVEPSAPPAQ